MLGARRKLLLLTGGLLGGSLQPHTPPWLRRPRLAPSLALRSPLRAADAARSRRCSRHATAPIAAAVAAAAHATHAATALRRPAHAAARTTQIVSDWLLVCVTFVAAPGVNAQPAGHAAAPASVRTRQTVSPMQLMW